MVLKLTPSNKIMKFKSLHSFQLSSNLTRNYACDQSEDNRFAIITDTYVYILTLKAHLTNPFQEIAFKKNLFYVAKYDISANIGIELRNFLYEMPKQDLFESVLSTELTSNLQDCAEMEHFAVSALWSPGGLVGKMNCLLGVLSNTFNLVIYDRSCCEDGIDEYRVIAGVTEHIVAQEKHEWKYSDRLPNSIKYQELKKRVAAVSPTAFTWGQVFKIDDSNYCTMFVGHMNGSITVWRIQERMLNDPERSQLHFLKRYQTDLGYISCLHWCQTKDAAGILLFADKHGRMNAINIENLNHNEASVVNELSFWDQKDDIQIEKISMVDVNDVTFIFAAKQGFLIIYGINSDGYVFDQKIHSVDNLYITGIHHLNNVALVLTLTGVLKQLTITVIDHKINIDEAIVPLKVDFSRLRTHGLFLSKSELMLGILAFPTRNRNLHRVKQLTKVFLFQNSQLNPLDLLMNNTTGSLEDYYDCLEVLRINCLKEKRFPWHGLPANLDYDKLTLLRLKTLRCISKISEEVFHIVPSVPNYDMKPYVLLHYLVDIKLAVNRIKKLLSWHNAGRELSTFQLQSIDVQNFFLKEMVVKDILAKAKVGDNFIDEISEVMRLANEIKYPPMPQCYWCGEKILGILCLPPHADTRCVISMMPIIMAPGYKCPICKCLAHREVGKELDIVICPYCDILMEQRFFPRRIGECVRRTPEPLKETLIAAYGLNFSGVVQSPCFDDCLKDEINLSDIEDNTLEFVMLSDSEEENDDNDSKLRKLYDNFHKLNLDGVEKGEENSNKDVNIHAL